jgi:hypothetical protein
MVPSGLTAAAGLVHAPGDADVHAPDRAGAEDDDEVALLDAELLLGVDGAGEGLGSTGLVVADAVGNPVQPVDLEDLLGHDHVLREPTVVLIADRGLVLADLHPPLAALVALAARHGRDALHPVAHLEPAGRVGTDLDDLTGDLVAHRRRAGDVDVAVVLDLDVRAAGGAGLDLDLHLTGAAVGLRDLFQPNVFGGVKSQGQHGALLCTVSSVTEADGAPSLPDWDWMVKRSGAARRDSSGQASSCLLTGDKRADIKVFTDPTVAWVTSERTGR